MTACVRGQMLSPKLRQALGVLLIILLGFGIRLSGLFWGQGWFHFGQGDGIEAYSVAVDYGLGSPQARYIGQPNFNSHAKLPGPLWTLFCYAGLRAWGSIEGVVFAIILLNTAAIGLTWWLAKRTLSPEAAFWAALFAATFPWVVFYSIGVYNPEVMSFLGALLFLALWRAACVDRAACVFWVPVLLLMMPQFHMSGLMLIPAVILILVLCPTRVDFRWLFGGVLAGLALYIPYVCGEMASGWPNTRGMLAGGGGYSWDGLKALSAPLSFLVNWAPRWTRSAAEYRELGRACFGYFGVFLAINILSALVAIFFITGAFAEIRKAMQGFMKSPRAAFARSPGIFFLAVLFVVPLLTALLIGKPFHTRYCIVLLPVQLALAAAATLRWFVSPRFGRWFKLGLLITICANVWLMPVMYRFQAAQIENGPVLIPSFRKLETIYQCLKTHAGPNAKIEVVDADPASAQSSHEPVYRDAALIRRFVEVREKENRSAVAAPKVTVYRLCSSAQPGAGDPAVAYRGNGIALVAVAR